MKMNKSKIGFLVLLFIMTVFLSLGVYLTSDPDNVENWIIIGLGIFCFLKSLDIAIVLIGKYIDYRISNK